MAEVYLNPENENLWEEGQSEAGEKVGPGDNAEAIKAAKKLLHEVSGRSVSYAVSESVLVIALLSCSASEQNPVDL